MEDKNTFLRVLGLVPGSNYTAGEIKKAWRKKCAEVHPDKGGSDKDFGKVMHAYNMLTNPEYVHKERVRRRGPAHDMDVRLVFGVDFDDVFLAER